MDRGQLIYAILGLKMPNGYRNHKGATLIQKLQKMSNQELNDLYLKLKV